MNSLMDRVRWAILLLTMPFWLGLGLVLWARNPLLILIPCGMGGLIMFSLTGALIYAAELRTRADWDLVIRSVLHRLGFKVAPPASLMHELDLTDTADWHDYNHQQAQSTPIDEDHRA
ncbi:MAG: hypothetical protein ACFE0Q_10250 [Anaerolineae bacterium]